MTLWFVKGTRPYNLHQSVADIDKAMKKVLVIR